MGSTETHEFRSAGLENNSVAEESCLALGFCKRFYFPWTEIKKKSMGKLRAMKIADVSRPRGYAVQIYLVVNKLYICWLIELLFMVAPRTQTQIIIAKL